jgi:hypothetical protein
VVALSGGWVCDPSLAGIVGFESCREYRCLSLEGDVCCQTEVSTRGLSLFRRSLTACSVSEGDSEASIMRKARPTRVYCAVEKKTKNRKIIFKCSFIEARKCGRIKGLIPEMTGQSLLM